MLAPYHFLLDKRLQGVNFAVVSSLDKLDLSERALADDLQSREVLGLLLGPQEPQIFNLSTSHVILLLDFPVVRDGRLFQDGLHLQCSSLGLARFIETSIMAIYL
jgi:hypothetical protein